MILDANVFLEVQLDQAYSDECESLLRSIHRGEREATITDFHVDAIAYLIGEIRDDPNEISIFLASLVGYDALAVRNLTLVDKLKACRIMREEGLDLDDSLAVYAAQSSDSKRLVTMDSDFDGVGGVEVVHPADLSADS